MLTNVKTGFLAGLMLYCGASLAASDKGEITIGVNNWAENIAVANMWEILLEERGYDVELFQADKAPILVGVSKGDIDITLELWLPAADGVYYERIQDNVDKIGPWFDNAQLGLAVPADLEITSIDQLNEHKDEFGATIYGIDPGSSLMDLTRDAIQQYDLDYKLLESSESGMLIVLEKAIKNDEPIVVTLWNPHWIWAKHELRYLQDPKGVYGEPDSIYAIAHKSFAQDFPEVAGWMSSWKMNDETLGGLMGMIREHGEGDPKIGAQAWIEANQGLVNQWLE